MEPYIGHIITTIAMLGGLAAVYTKIMSRLTKIETRLEIDDKYRDERHADMILRMRDVVYRYCRDECPQNRTNTNPNIKQYDGEILP